MVGLEELIYELVAAKHTTQFTETTEKLRNCMQANYKSGADIAGAPRQLCELTITMLTATTITTDAGGNYALPTAADECIFKHRFDADYTQEQCYDKYNKKAFAILYEHCARELKALLKGDNKWGSIENSQDRIHLLRMTKSLCCKFGPTKQEARAIMAADKTIMCYIQEGHVSISEYLRGSIPWWTPHSAMVVALGIPRHW
jgi:hypothetical protein